MTLIELLVVMLIIGMALALAAVGLGAIGGSELRQSASELSAAVRYTYNLAAINNKTYALYLDLSGGTYYAAQIPEDGGDCERLLLAPNGKDTDPLILRYGDMKDVGSKSSSKSKDDDEQAPGMFDAGMAGADGGAEEPGPPDWTGDDGTAAGRLWNMLGDQTKSLASEESAKAGYDLAEGEGEPKRLPTVRKNQLAKAKSLGRDVKFEGVVVRQGSDPIAEGVVPIVFFPHGVAQRALIYLTDSNGDALTVDILSLQGNGRITSGRTDPADFAEEKK